MESILITGLFAFFGGAFLGLVIGISIGLRIGLKINVQKPSRMGYVVALGTSIILLITSICMSLYTVYFVSNSVIAKAEVTEVIESRSSEGDLTYFPKYTYYDNQNIRYNQKSNASDSSLKVGDSINIRYLKTNPIKSRIDTFYHHWLGSILTFFLSCGTLLLAGILYYKYKTQNHQYLANNKIEGTF